MIRILCLKTNWRIQVSISIDSNEILFNYVKNSKISYSQDLAIANTAEYGSGVLLDLFITGTDFYDTTNKYSYCDGLKKLSLSRIKFFASKGNYNTRGLPDADDEGYRPIKTTEPFSSNFYQNKDILPKGPVGSYFWGNLLSSEEKLNISFKIDIPKYCKGNFNNGSIYLWAEAV